MSDMVMPDMPSLVSEATNWVAAGKDISQFPKKAALNAPGYTEAVKEGTRLQQEALAKAQNPAPASGKAADAAMTQGYTPGQVPAPQNSSAGLVRFGGNIISKAFPGIVNTLSSVGDQLGKAARTGMSPQNLNTASGFDSGTSPDAISSATPLNNAPPNMKQDIGPVIQKAITELAKTDSQKAQQATDMAQSQGIDLSGVKTPGTPAPQETATGQQPENFMGKQSDSLMNWLLQAASAAGDAYGASKLAFAGVQSPTRLQQQYKMKVASQQQANQSFASAKAELMKIDPQLRAQIQLAITNGDVDTYNKIIQENKLFPLHKALIQAQTYANLLQSANNPSAYLDPSALVDKYLAEGSLGTTR